MGPTREARTIRSNLFGRRMRLARLQANRGTVSRESSADAADRGWMAGGPERFFAYTADTRTAAIGGPASALGFDVLFRLRAKSDSILLGLRT